MNSKKKITNFGFEVVDWEAKTNKVAAVFNSVAEKYDLMNNLMSLGLHHLWKRFAIEIIHVRPGQFVLDLAGGSGDLTKLLSYKVGLQGKVILADINAAMLRVGRNRLLDAGLCLNIGVVQANAEALPFADNSFHCITMGFGLRNVTDQEQALCAIYRVCKPGGKILILEFSTAILPGLKFFYDWYSFNVLPQLGDLIVKDANSYRYLAESIRMHPTQEELKTMIEQAGFADCRYYNLSGGIVAIHTAYKY